MRWAKHVTRRGSGEVHKGFWWGTPRVKSQLEDLGVEGRIILKCILKKWDGAWTGLMWLRIGAGGGS